MYNTQQFINQPISQVEAVFKKHNQPTYLYLREHGGAIKLLEQFGTNEGGPSYVIFINTDGIVIEIKTQSMYDFY
ncbi:MAG: hypothetical protein EBU90_15005 [Proteobacteria bacterium]|nr:hypothetical protein [Pseudomonadota bacterium]NBP15312.1 hypothetical protein [bacterium]